MSAETDDDPPPAWGFVIVLPDNVWRMIDELRATGLYGESRSDAVLALMRPGLGQAVQAGFVELKK